MGSFHQKNPKRHILAEMLAAHWLSGPHYYFHLISTPHAS